MGDLTLRSDESPCVFDNGGHFVPVEIHVESQSHPSPGSHAGRYEKPFRFLIDQLGFETVIERVPENYLKSIFGAYLASRYVYQYGLSSTDFGFFEFMSDYAK